MTKIKLMFAAALATTALVAIPAASVSAHSYHHGDHHNNWKKHKHHSWQPNIVEKAVQINKETGEFSTLIAAASCTDVAAKLSNNKRNYTLFAPTDAAFAKANLNAENVCTALDKATLTAVLEYHVTRGKKDAEKVLARESLHMLNGDKAVISGTTIDGQNIVQTDVKTRNGIIHVIDGVMMP